MIPLSLPRISGQNGILAGAIAMVTVAGCALSLTITVLSIRLDIAGFSASAIGLNTAAGGVATLVAAPCIGWAAFRLGVGRVLFASLLLGGMAMLGFAFSADYSVWLGLRFAVGVSVTILFVLSEFWIGSVSTTGSRGLIIGIYATSLGVGFAVGPLLLALIGSAGALPFLAGAGLFWIAILPLALIVAGAPTLVERSRKPAWIFLREAPVATLAGLLHGALEVACIGLLPVYALRAGAGATEGALFASLFVLGNSALQVPVGLLSDRIERHKLLIVIATLGLAGALLLVFADLGSALVFEIALLIWGGIVGGLYPVGLAQLGARYTGADLAGANAAFIMAYALGMLVGPPLVGAGLDMMPPRGFFLTIALMLGVYLVVAVTAGRRRTSPERRRLLPTCSRLKK